MNIENEHWHDWDADPLIPDDFVCDSLAADSPIELTTSWLTANMYHGCSFACAYCFRHRWDPLDRPEEALSIEQAAKLLTSHRLFRAHHTPLSVNVSSTDPLHPRVRESTLGLAEFLDEMGLANPYGIVTKGLLSTDNAQRLARLRHIRPVVLVSYSEMPQDIEPIPTKIRISTMQNARESGIPVLISCKPVVPGWNDSYGQIESVMRVAGEYANAVIYGGLRVDSAISAAIVSAGRTVPVTVPDRWGGKVLDPATREKFEKARDAVAPSIPIYEHTSCAVSLVMGMKNYNSLRKRSPHSCSSSCPIPQVSRCDS